MLLWLIYSFKIARRGRHGQVLCPCSVSLPLWERDKGEHRAPLVRRVASLTRAGCAPLGARAARAGQQRHHARGWGIGWLLSPFPKKTSGVWIWPMRLALCVPGWCPSPTGSGGAHLPLAPCHSLSGGSEAPRRCCAAARVPAVTKQKGTKAGESEPTLRAVKRCRGSEQEGPSLKRSV